MDLIRSVLLVPLCSFVASSTTTMVKKKASAQAVQPAPDPPGSSLIICRNKYVRDPTLPFESLPVGSVLSRERITKNLVLTIHQALAIHFLLPRTMAATTARNPRLARPPELYNAGPSPG